MPEWLKRTYFQLAYWLAWAVFGAGGLLLTLLFLPLYLLPASEARARFVRCSIRRLFRFYLGLLRWLGIMFTEWHGFEQPLPERAVYIANHPGLLDAPILLARLPDAICVFKPKLLRNPAIGPLALLAGYVSGGGGVDAVRESAARVSAGRSLLIFPEGTRTQASETLGELQSGFALIAARARASVQLVIIRATEGMTTRGRPWWKVPLVMPARVLVSLDRRWDDTASLPASRLAREVEVRLRECLSGPGPKDS